MTFSQRRAWLPRDHHFPPHTVCPADASSGLAQKQGDRALLWLLGTMALENALIFSHSQPPDSLPDSPES